MSPAGAILDNIIGESDIDLGLHCSLFLFLRGSPTQEDRRRMRQGHLRGIELDCFAVLRDEVTRGAFLSELQVHALKLKRPDKAMSLTEGETAAVIQPGAKG